MIARLRRRFILITMASVFTVLIIIVGGINLASSIAEERDASRLLDMLSAGDGFFPKPNKPFEHDFGDMSPETPYETRFFTVRFQPSGDVAAVNTGNIAAVGTDQAVDYALEVLSRERMDGYFGQYRYRVTDEGTEGTLVIFLDRTKSQLSRKSFLNASILISAAGLLAIFLSVWLLSKRVVRPFAERYEKQKRFITDAGHEIKTPLAIISADAEVLELETGENEWTRGIRHQVVRLTELTRSLIDLAKLDEETAAPIRVPFSLSDTASETVEAFSPLAATNGKCIRADVTPGITYTGDEQAIRRLFGILLDNAVKYAVPCGTIAFSVRKTGKSVVIACQNQVESIERGKLPQLFERFYRGDASRGGDTRGYGLGLSMAQAIVTSHKGKISAKSDDGKSVVFTVIL
ncbi:MAG: HAMP domain-containing sensor histidine kinase [Clostridiaceae bacterium]|nr:HAMP domain-containing sensor histidine kinase [Clostridiaceae bacterium]